MIFKHIYTTAYYTPSMLENLPDAKWIRGITQWDFNIGKLVLLFGFRSDIRHYISKLKSLSTSLFLQITIHTYFHHWNTVTLCALVDTHTWFLFSFLIRCFFYTLLTCIVFKIRRRILPQSFFFLVRYKRGWQKSCLTSIFMSCKFFLLLIWLQIMKWIKSDSVTFFFLL